VLAWERLPYDVSRRDKPVAKLFEPRNDPKGWDRASITLNTHPLHREPRLTPADLMLACSFPLWVAAVTVDSDLRWAWTAVVLLGLACGAGLFARGLADERRPPEDFL
jgi:hypothetical protein